MWTASTDLRQPPGRYGSRLCKAETSRLAPFSTVATAKPVLGTNPAFKKVWEKRMRYHT